MSEALLIGAGPAGLTAAYELQHLGVSSTVLEADRLVGGISRTVEHEGYRFDIGGHRFFSKIQLINQVWDDVLGPELLTRPRLSRIYYRDHFFDYPLKAGNALAGLGLLESLHVAFSYARARFLPAGEESNFEQWVVNRFGHRLYSIFFKTYTEKVWGIPCSEISADWAAQRIRNLSLIEALRSAILGNSGRTRDGQVIPTLIEDFKYPRLGPGMMWERFETLLAGKGNETRRGVRAERIHHSNGRVTRVEARNASGEKEIFGGDHFLSSMPLRELIHALDPAPPVTVIAAADGLRYRDYLTVVLMVKREQVFPDNWIYIHSPEVKMGRIQNYKNWSPMMVPDQSRTSLGLEYFLWDDDEEWRWPDGKLIERGIEETVRLGLIEPDEVEGGTVVRMAKAYPIYDGDYLRYLQTIREYLGTFRNLQTIGRNGQHRYNNQDHSMLTGIYAARNIVGGDYDIWAVNVDQDYHEEPVPEEGAAEDRLVPAAVSGEAFGETDATVEWLERVIMRVDSLSMGLSIGIITGFGLFAATAALLIKGGRPLGPTLSLLGQYLPGFSVTWPGAFIGLLEAGVGGFLFGCAGSGIWNGAVMTYLHFLKRREEAREERDLLDKI